MATPPGDYVINIGPEGDDKSTSSSEDDLFHDASENPPPQQSLGLVVPCDVGESEINLPSASSSRRSSNSGWNLVKRGRRVAPLPWDGVELPTRGPINPCLWALVSEDGPSTAGASENPPNSGGLPQDLPSSAFKAKQIPSAPIPQRKRYSASASTVQPGGRMRSFIEEIPMTTLKEAIPITTGGNITIPSPVDDEGESALRENDTPDNINNDLLPNAAIVGNDNTSVGIGTVAIISGEAGDQDNNDVTLSEERGNERNVGDEGEAQDYSVIESAVIEKTQEVATEENLTHWKRFRKWQPDDNNFIFEWMRYAKLPGIKEIAKKQANKCYRCTWFTIVTICAILGTILSYVTVQKYLGHPLIITVRSTEVNVDDMALPTIHAITSENYKMSELEQAFMIYKQSQEEIYQLETGWTPYFAARLLYFIDHICNTLSSMKKKFLKNKNDPKDMVKNTVNISGVKMEDDPTDEVNENKIIPFLQKGMIDCTKMVSHCVLSGDVMECRRIIVSTMTNMGMACSFNRMPYRARRKGNTMLTALGTDHEETSINIWKEYNPFHLNFRAQMNILSAKHRGTKFVDNFTEGKISSAIPQGSSGGKTSGLSMVLRYSSNMTCPQTDSPGFLIQLTAPNEQPNLRDFGIVIPLNHEARVAIFPEVTVADESVRSIDKYDRGCFFSDEMELDYFESYTQANCIDQCLTKQILTECNCTMIYNTQSPGSKLCTPVGAECAKNATAKMYKEGIEKVCSNCKQDCEKITYRYQVSLTPFSKDNPPKLEADKNGNTIKEGEQFSIVHYFWGASNILVYELTRKWDLAETLSLIGGAIGLTNGLTVLDGFKIPLGYIYALVGSSAIYYGVKSHNNKKRTERIKRNWKQLMEKLSDKNTQTTMKWELMIEAMKSLESQVDTLHDIVQDGNSLAPVPISAPLEDQLRG